MKRRQLIVLAATCAVVALTTPSHALIGLAARFGEIILENVAPGRTYNLREAARLPLGAQNIGDAETTILVEFIQPRTVDISKDYEAIPDPSWFKAIPETITIGPRSVGFFDILMTVPNDPKYKGKHFQVTVKMRQVGGFFAVGVENKIRFSVGPGPETLQEEKKQKAMQQLDFNVTPQSLFITEVPVGQLYDVKKEQNKGIRVANYSQDPLEVMFEGSRWNAQLTIPEGFEPIPDASWIVFASSHVKVAGEEIGHARMQLRIPDDKKYRGKKYAALIRTALASGFWLDAPVKVLIETKP